MAAIILHPATEQAMWQFMRHPSQALIVTGPRGVGKGSVARSVAAELLHSTAERLADQPYLKVVDAGEAASIPVAAVRELEHFLSLKVPGQMNRVVLIEDAQLLTVEAQNALLKTLEEPPQGSVIILTVAHEQDLLPTVRSRASILAVHRPQRADLAAFFREQGHAQPAADKYIVLSGGLPGLLAPLLAGDNTHPLLQAADTARNIFQKSAFERLCLIDSLAKQRQLCLDTLSMMQYMAHVALLAPRPSLRWQRVLEQSYDAEVQLRAYAQPKLVLVNLMLTL
ncbi:MAG TPA: AAA family ATPase [Candidatus Saccharimonadales bacterium]